MSAPSQFDTGERFTPVPWEHGNVDFDDDTSQTALTVHAGRLGDAVVLHVTAANRPVIVRAADDLTVTMNQPAQLPDPDNPAHVEALARELSLADGGNPDYVMPAEIARLAGEAPRPEWTRYSDTARAQLARLRRFMTAVGTQAVTA